MFPAPGPAKKPRFALRAVFLLSLSRFSLRFVPSFACALPA
jgi:hypothetical protein